LRLIELLQNGDIHDRKLAALTLGEIGPAAQDAIPALFAAVEDDDDSLAELAEEALEKIDLVDEDAEAA
jgi:HEAT repeat protein